MMTIYKKIDYIIACVQLNTILNMLPGEEKEKIPSEFLEEIKKYNIKNYRYKYDYSKDLKDQEMHDLTKELIYDIYVNYLCGEKEKKEINDKFDFFMKNIKKLP